MGVVRENGAVHSERAAQQQVESCENLPYYMYIRYFLSECFQAGGGTSATSVTHKLIHSSSKSAVFSVDVSRSTRFLVYVDRLSSSDLKTSMFIVRCTPSWHCWFLSSTLDISANVG